MEEEKAALQAEIEQKEAELNQLTEDIEKAEGDEKQGLEERKTALAADVAEKKARLDEMNQAPPAPPEVPPPTEEPTVEPGPISAAEGDSTPKPEGDPTPKPEGDPTPKPEGDPTPKPEGEPTPVDEKEPSLKAPKPAPSGEPSDSGTLPREQMLKILQDERAKAVAKLSQPPQDVGSQPLGEDMEKWLATLKNLRKEGIIDESDVKLDKVETKIKSKPAGGDPKKIQADIDDIDKIISIQDESVFQKEFTQWYEKQQAAAKAAGPGGPPEKGGAKGTVPVPDATVLAQLKEAEARAAKAATEVEALKKKLAEYAQKENMTADDIKDMEAKQKLLMDKMAEFEQITKLIQSLIGLTETPSSQLGFHPSTDGDRAGKPEDNLPKVIVCGTGDIDTVPKIIVCEAAGGKDGNKPIFQELGGPARAGPGGGTPGVAGSYPAGPGFHLGGPGSYQGAMGYPGPLAPGSYPGGPLAPGSYPGGPVALYPGGMGHGAVGYLGGGEAYMGGPVYRGGPGFYPGGPSPYPNYPVSYPGYPGMGRPGMTPNPPCLDYFNRSKEERKKKKKTTGKQPAIDYRGSSGCNDWCKNYYEKKREKRKKKCFCQLSGFCPKN